MATSASYSPKSGHFLIDFKIKDQFHFGMQRQLFPLVKSVKLEFTSALADPGARISPSVQFFSFSSGFRQKLDLC